MPKIIIDHREPKSLLRQIEKRGIETEVKQLATDFIIETKTLNGKILNVGIERKTQLDFLNSIIDKRILNQISFLKENFDSSLLIIEGNQNIYSLRNFHPNSIRGMLATIAIDFQIPIIHSLGQGDTAAILEIIANRLEKSRNPLNYVVKKKHLSLSEMQEFLIESLPGIGPTISKDLLKEFKNIKNIVNASENDLMKIDKLGKIKAKLIKEVLEKDYN